MTQKDFVKIYARTDRDFEGFVAALSEILGSAPDKFHTIRTRNFEIDFFRSKADFIPGSDDFIHWPYYLDMSTTDVPREVFAAACASFLESLWQKKIDAVAACDFEDELPFRGGIEKYSSR